MSGRRQRGGAAGAGPRFAVGAILAVARRELRRRWPALLALGLAAGVVGGVIAGSLAVARRTGTAFDRLTRATAADDVRAFVFSDDRTLAEGVARLPPVQHAWVGQMAVARFEGRGLNYSGVFIGPSRPPDLLAPIVVEGRPANPDAPNEVVVIERWADVMGVSPGDSIDLAFLTSEEFASFDVGFGEPDGPRVRMTVTGTVRLTGTIHTPIFTTPAFAAGPIGSATIRAVDVLLLRLRDGAAGVGALRAAVADLSRSATTGPGAGEFLPVQLVVPDEEAKEVDATARILVLGLLVLGAAVALAGGLAVTQALARHHDAGAGDQRVEDAIGIPRSERVAARTLAALPSSAVAAATTALLTAAAGRFEPLGGVVGYEPHPGFAPNLGLAAVAAAAVCAALTAVAALTARRASRRRPPRAPRASGAIAWSRAGVRAAPAAAIASGIALALPHPGSRGRSVPVRSTIAGAVVGIAGLVAAASFAASLSRLVATPVRWGWQADAAVVNARDEIVTRLLDNRQLAAISVMDRAPVRVGGRHVDGNAVTPRRGVVGWTILEGRPPAGAGEVVLGLRVATRLGVDIGDEVRTSKGSLRVVGSGIGPTLPPESIGEAVLLTADGLAVHAEADRLREALITVAPGADRGAVLEALGAEYELNARTPPPQIANLEQLGSLPVLLGAFLATVGLAALVHALVTTVRRRRRDLAILRTLGFTPRQVAASVAVLALTTVGTGLLVGIPLGLGVGRLVWWVVADATGVAGDVAVRGLALLAVLAGAPLVALAAGLLPARAAARLRPSAALHAE